MKPALKTIPVLLLFFLSCKQSTVKQETEIISKYCYVVNQPTLDSDGKLNNYFDTVFLFVYKSFSLYKFPYYTDDNGSATKIVKNNDTTIFELNITPTNKFRYILFAGKSGSPYVYPLDSSFKWDQTNRQALAALKKRNGIGEVDILSMRDALILTDSLYDDASGETVLAFNVKNPGDDGDTVMLYLQKNYMNGISLSISESYDKVKFPSKLVRFRVTYKEKIWPLTNAIVPKREFKIEIKQLEPEKEEKKLLKVLKTFEKLPMQ